MTTREVGAAEPSRDPLPSPHVLVVPHGHVVNEARSLAATQHRGPSTMVLDDDIAILPSSPREAGGGHSPLRTDLPVVWGSTR